MNALTASSLAPFVPSGKDYDGARRLFAELGFEEMWENDGYAGFRNGEARFILQRFDHHDFASNFMIALTVPDLDAWFLEVSMKDLDKKYAGFRIAKPTEVPWGREVNFIDPAGVCWHVSAAS